MDFNEYDWKARLSELPLSSFQIDSLVESIRSFYGESFSGLNPPDPRLLEMRLESSIGELASQYSEYASSIESVESYEIRADAPFEMTLIELEESYSAALALKKIENFRDHLILELKSLLKYTAANVKLKKTEKRVAHLWSFNPVSNKGAIYDVTEEYERMFIHFLLLAFERQQKRTRRLLFKFRMRFLAEKAWQWLPRIAIGVVLATISVDLISNQAPTTLIGLFISLVGAICNEWVVMPMIRKRSIQRWRRTLCRYFPETISTKVESITASVVSYSVSYESHKYSRSAREVEWEKANWRVQNAVERIMSGKQSARQSEELLALLESIDFDNPPAMELPFDLLSPEEQRRRVEGDRDGE